MAELSESQKKTLRIKILKKFTNRGVKLTTNAIEIIINTVNRDPLELSEYIITNMSALSLRKTTLDIPDIQAIINEVKEVDNPPIEHIITVSTIDTMPQLLISQQSDKFRIVYEERKSLINAVPPTEALERKLAYVKADFDRYSKSTMVVGNEAVSVSIIRPSSILSCDSDDLIGCIGVLYYYDDEFYLEDLDVRVKLDVNQLFKSRAYPSCFLINGSIVVCYGRYSLNSEVFFVESITSVSIQHNKTKFIDSNNITIPDEMIPNAYGTWKRDSGLSAIPVKASNKLHELALTESYSMTFINNFMISDPFQLRNFKKILATYQENNFAPNIIVLTGNFAASSSQNDTIEAAELLHAALLPYKKLLADTQLLLIPNTSDLTCSPSILMPRGPLISSPWAPLKELFGEHLVLGSSPSVVRMCDKIIYIVRHPVYNTFRKHSILPPKSSNFEAVAMTMDSNMSAYPITDPNLILWGKSNLLNFWQKPDLVIVADDLDYASYSDSYLSPGNFTQGNFATLSLSEGIIQHHGHKL